MTKYYELTIGAHQTYSAATFLNLIQRCDVFDNAWVSKLQPWIEVMLVNCREIWERDYAHLAPHKNVKRRDAFEEWLSLRVPTLQASEDLAPKLSGGLAPKL